MNDYGTYTVLRAGGRGDAVNGQRLGARQSLDATTQWSNTIALQAGTRYDIEMDYFESGGGASAKLSWSSPSVPKEVVPQSQLYSSAALWFINGPAGHPRLPPPGVTAVAHAHGARPWHLGSNPSAATVALIDVTVRKTSQRY